jgi:hypothetical protein
MHNELIRAIFNRTRAGLSVMEVDEEHCLIDSAATNTIIRETKYFQIPKKKIENIITIAGSNDHIVGSGRAVVVLPSNTSIFIEEAYLYPEVVLLSSHSKTFVVVATM